jgi:hypothetical protein
MVFAIDKYRELIGSPAEVNCWMEIKGRYANVAFAMVREDSCVLRRRWGNAHLI